MMLEEEVEKVITEKFAEVLATQNKGMIMKAVMGKLKGKADGKVIQSGGCEAVPVSLFGYWGQKPVYNL